MHPLLGYYPSSFMPLTLTILAAILPTASSNLTGSTTSSKPADILPLNTLTDTSNSTLTWSLLCYSPYEAPPGRATLEIDCILAAYETLLARNADKLVDWHGVRPATPDYIAQRVHGFCAITFGTLGATSRESFPLMLVARQAALVISECMREGTGWRGGKSLLGPKGQYWLEVKMRRDRMLE